MKKCLLLFLVILIGKLNAQEHKTKLLGTVLTNKKRLANVHVINLNSKIGTITNNDGEFEIYANLNDTLYISSIQYKKVKVAITDLMISSKKLYILTNSITYELDEVVVRNHNLTQSLYYDILHKPTSPSFMNGSNFNNSNLSKTNFKVKESNYSRPPSIEHMVNPIAGGGGGASAGIPNFQLLRERKLRKKLKQQKEIPMQIIASLRKDFFVEKLHIPSDEIHLFLSYCEPRNIITLYTKNNLLKVIKILQEEAPKYILQKKDN